MRDLSKYVLMVLILLFINCGLGTGFILEFKKVIFILIELL